MQIVDDYGDDNMDASPSVCLRFNQFWMKSIMNKMPKLSVTCFIEKIEISMIMNALSPDEIVQIDELLSLRDRK